MHWRSRHRFCGVCGAACEPHSAGNVMACTGCKTHHFPRTDPAVIMLVTRGDRALLGHSQRFPNSAMYSTLAGFVEPGESLEEAVAREVLEESGIRVGAVRYHSSQPWPFPASIMLGFYAEALTEEITIDPHELTDARWFSRDQMRDPTAHGFALPRGRQHRAAPDRGLDGGMKRMAVAALVMLAGCNDFYKFDGAPSANFPDVCDDQVYADPTVKRPDRRQRRQLQLRGPERGPAPLRQAGRGPALHAAEGPHPQAAAWSGRASTTDLSGS